MKMTSQCLLDFVILISSKCFDRHVLYPPDFVIELTQLCFSPSSLTISRETWICLTSCDPMHVLAKNSPSHLSTCKSKQTVVSNWIKWPNIFPFKGNSKSNSALHSIMKCRCDCRNLKWEIRWPLPHLPQYLCPVKCVTGYMSLCHLLAKCALGKLLILSLGQRNSNSKAFDLALICPLCGYMQLTWGQINTRRIAPFQLILVFQNFF